MLKEPEIEVPLDDEDEEGENEEGKPKKKKPKKDSIGSKSKKQDPNAPPQNRWGKHLRDTCGGISYVLQGSGFLAIPSLFFLLQNSSSWVERFR